MKNLKQISRVLLPLISVAVIGLLVWRFVVPESSAPQEGALPQSVTSAVQNSAAVTASAAPVVAPITEPVAAAVTESAKESSADLHDDHDEKIDPPSPAIVDAIREMKKPTPDEGKMTENPDGSVKVNLGNRFQSVPVATIGKDGKVHVDYHGEKYVQDNQTVENSKPEEAKKPVEQKQEVPTP